MTHQAAKSNVAACAQGQTISPASEAIEGIGKSDIAVSCGEGGGAIDCDTTVKNYVARCRNIA